MSTSADLVALAQHMAWADATTWESVLRTDHARSDSRIRIWLHHIHTVQQAFLQVWREEAPRFRDPADFPSMVELCQWGRDGHEACQAFLSNATPDVFAREMRVPWAAEIERTTKRQLHAPTLAQTVTQIAMHSAHHRGQINARLREVGGEPVTSDFIVWVWWGRPAASWMFLDQPVPGA